MRPKRQPVPVPALCAAVAGLFLVVSSGLASNGSARDRFSPTPVADAAAAGDALRVRELLQQGADVNAAHGDGFTALHWAALRGDLEVVEMLLVAGAHEEARTRLGGHTPLMVAARSGHSVLVAHLAARDENPDAATSNGTTSLMLASAAGDVASIETLLEAGASPWSRETAHGQTALHFAAAAGRTDAVRALIGAGAEHCATTSTFDAVGNEKVLRAAFIQKYRRGREQAKAKEKAAGGDPAGQAESRAGGDAGSNGEGKTKQTREGRQQRRQVAADSPQVNTLTAEDPERSKDPKRGWFSRRKARSAADKGGRGAPAGDSAQDQPRPLSFGQLVGVAGGWTPLHYAAREGHSDTAIALLDLGADINHLSDGDRSSPLLVATVNGHFDLAAELLARGADPNLASDAGVAPLYAAVNVYWAPHAFYPQPTAQYQQQHTLNDVLEKLLEAGADPNRRLSKKVWYTGYNFDQSGIDETGATAFWRAAQSADVEAMRLLVRHGADWRLPTLVVPERRAPNGRNAGKDLSKDAPQLGDEAVSPFLVASGAGYVGNFHRVAPGGFLRAARYFVEELGADVTAADYKGRNVLHNAAMRGDNQMLFFYILRGADPHGVTRDGDNVADLANGPVQRIQPFPETLALLETLGVQHNDRCVSC